MFNNLTDDNRVFYKLLFQLNIRFFVPFFTGKFGGAILKQSDLYDREYTKLNHTYNEIFSFYEQLQECCDRDSNIVDGLELILRVFNPVLDEIKSKMTVKTRYIEPAKDSGGKKDGKGGNILYGDFSNS